MSAEFWQCVAIGFGCLFTIQILMDEPLHTIRVIFGGRRTLRSLEKDNTALRRENRNLYIENRKLRGDV